MTDDDNNNIPEFGAMTQGLFAPVEQTVGTDQYTANVENTKSCTEGNKALTELMLARVEQRKAVIQMLHVLIVLLIPPYLMVLVYLFKLLVV